MLRNHIKKQKLRLQSFGLFLRTGFTNKRTHGAFVSTALSSLVNFVIAILIARVGTIGDVADYAIGFAGFLTVVGVTRAMVSEPTAARLLSTDEVKLAGRQISFYSLCLSTLALLIGLVTGQSFLLVIGIFGHAVAISDYSKFVSMVFGKPSIAVAQEALKAILILPLLMFFEFALAPLELFIVWLAATAVSGYSFALVQRISVVPSVQRARVPFKEAVSYAMDYLLGAGTTQVITFALGGLAAPAVNASLRGAGTLLGPINVIVTSIRALIIPYLSKKLRLNNELLPASQISTALVLVALPIIIIVNLIPNEWGRALLGDTWAPVSVVLPILSIELLFTMMSSAPFAGHRSLGAHRRTLVLRSLLAPIKLIAIIGAAVTGGYVWAALAKLATAVFTAVVWWASYVSLMRKA